MMRLLGNKKNVKIVSLLVAAIFVLGVGGLAYTQMATPAMAAPTSNIGVLDPQKILAEPNSKLAQEAQKEFTEFQEQLKKDYDGKIANAGDADKQKLQIEAQQKLQEKQMEIMKNIQEKVKDASKSVADTKGLSVVLVKDAVLYGGVDITDLVNKKLNEESAKK